MQTFVIPKGKRISIEYQRHRSEVSHIKVEFRREGAPDWQTLVNAYVEPKDQLHKPGVDNSNWDGQCRGNNCQIRVSGYMKIGSGTQPFGYEDLNNVGGTHTVTLWGAQGDGSQNTTVTVREH